MSPLSELLAQRSYVRFLLARLSGLTANQMLMVAVAWHMYDITSSAWDLGLVGLFQFVPALVMTLPAASLERVMPASMMRRVVSAEICQVPRTRA